jgi:hypothetical protein
LLISEKEAEDTTKSVRRTIVRYDNITGNPFVER